MTSNYVFIDFKFCWPWLQIMLALPSHFFVLTSNFVLHGLQNMLALTKNYISIAKYIALTTNNVYIDLNFFFHWQLKFGIEFNFRLCLHRLEIMFRLNSKKCLLWLHIIFVLHSNYVYIDCKICRLHWFQIIYILDIVSNYIFWTLFQIISILDIDF